AGLDGISVSGWALDLEIASPILTHVYVDGTAFVAAADRPRADVASGFVGYGPNHGYSATVPASPGAHRVCVFAINVGAGASTVLGCRDVVVPGGPPVGNVELAAAGVGEVRLSGWALDPDTSAPIDVHVYAGGR